tara:strand:- start:1068 stop:1241 length:174 start_codon:yes stop_codon:yes gene_type:complete
MDNKIDLSLSRDEILITLECLQEVLQDLVDEPGGDNGAYISIVRAISRKLKVVLNGN